MSRTSRSTGSLRRSGRCLRGPVVGAACLWVLRIASCLASAPASGGLAFTSWMREDLTTLPPNRSAARHRLVSRPAAGFGRPKVAPSDSEEEDKKPATEATKPATKLKRRRVSDAQLEEDHGKMWKVVKSVLIEGKPAPSPEAMVRARFSAAKVKDPIFLAATQLNPKRDENAVGSGVEHWAELLGLPGYPSLEENAWRTAVKNIESIDILGTKSVKEAGKKRLQEVEFKMRCGDKIIHEKALFLTNDKRGYIYTNEPSFSNLEDVSKDE